ncbi:dimethylarginine dimethylaminohydrolase family protein [Salimicrobium halophilum]|uniref:N-Dimethylarginine dimethylaminohydrolase n=1 Tax=Salimicrobium halophilum TaxID=86666 RepID=A0A1G8WLA1_9BACI|nr:arginine deiminase family protein [Salimicrobium halophilum]SDJ78823.1 N-Dimethylarginine dimethylaminohydrolase [Salimicrobium halophilum]
MEDTIPDYNVGCTNEYGILKKAIVTPPSYMKITEAINETQKHYKDANIDREFALSQHRGFVRLLKENGVEVMELPAAPHLPEQVFTRDIAFVIGPHLVLGAMEESIRQGESAVLKQWLEFRSLPYEEPPEGSIEGGDVLVDGETIWIGRAKRTTTDAVEDLRRRFPEHRIEPLLLQEDILHLDCVFSILNEHTAIVYPPAFSEEGLRKIESRFETITVTDDERFYMGPNVLSLGNDTIVSLPLQKRLNSLLREKGFRVLEHDFSEIIKSGGSFRCCTLPLLRT